jgi:hypothetical protein
MRELVIIAIVVIFFGGLIWTLKPPQTRPKFYFALSLALLGLATAVAGLIRGGDNGAGLRAGLGATLIWGAVAVLNVTTTKWQRITAWVAAFLGLVLSMAGH